MWSPRSFDEALTDKQAALADVITGEGTSIMAELALGNEHFARELLDADASVVEKLLHRIEDVKEALARRKDAAAKEAFEEVRKAEQMFLDALAEKGMRFEKGKIIGAGEEREVKKSAKDNLDFYELTPETKKQNVHDILNMGAVKEMTGHEFEADGKTSLMEKVMAFFDSVGNAVETKELGTVGLTKATFRDDKGHGFTRNKIISFNAIPEALLNGRIIDVYYPENKQYARITYAAPISIQGEKYYICVMVQKDNQSSRVYMHDVVKETAISSFNTEPTTQKSEGIRDRDHRFMTIILQEALSVKPSDEISSENFSKPVQKSRKATQQNTEKSYRYYRSPQKVMSAWGHAMFVDDPYSSETYGDFAFGVEHSELVKIDELRDEILAKMREDYEIGELPEDMEYAIDQNGLSFEELADEYAPEDIVMSAQGWDNGQFVEWIYNKIIEPKDIKGIKTPDGAIVFDESIISRETDFDHGTAVKRSRKTVTATPPEVDHLTPMQKQTVANHTRAKVYTKAEALAVVEDMAHFLDENYGFDGGMGESSGFVTLTKTVKDAQSLFSFLVKIHPNKKTDRNKKCVVKNKFPISENNIPKPIDKRPKKVYNDANEARRLPKRERPPHGGKNYGYEIQETHHPPCDL